MYNESEFIQIAEIQHFVYCPRQWGLAYLENQWQENILTVEGHALHDKAHDESSIEKRGRRIIVRGMQVKSYKLGVNGNCDVVEFLADAKGINIPAYGAKYRLLPVEYKHGEPKNGDEDTLQLVLQAMCLEEMLCTTIDVGAIYYGKTRHRLKVELTDRLRQKAIDILAKIRNYIRQGKTPIVKKHRGCNKCSLKDLCQAGLPKKQSVQDYLTGRIAE